jgi:hypothetical protein
VADVNLLRAIVASAESIGAQTSKTSGEVLAAIRDAIFRNDIAGGKVLLSTTEGGGTVTFSLPQDQTPQQLMVLIQLAIDRINGARRVRRLRVSFAQSTPS